MAVIGLRGTGDWGAGERPKNFREMILWRNPNGSAVLTALMARMRKESVDDPEFNWWEEEQNPVRLTVTTAVGTAVTTIAIDGGDAQDLVIGDVLLVEKANGTTYDNELIQVTQIDSATVFNATRGAANTTPATIANNANLTKIGNAFEEGADAPDASTRNPTKFLNYTQIFKTAYRMTNTALATRARTGDIKKNDKKRKMFDHSTAMEYAFLFGRPYEDSGGTELKRFTGGLAHFLSGAARIVVATTTTRTEAGFLAATYDVFDYTTDEGSSMERLVLAGNAALNKLNQVAKAENSSRVVFDKTIKVFGMELQRWILPQGTFFIKTHPLMNVHGRFKNDLFILEPRGIIYRPLRGRDTKPDEGPGGRGIQNNGEDQFKGQWLGEVGAEFHHLKTMKWIRGFGT
jgi:hypothetical protein